MRTPRPHFCQPPEPLGSFSCEGVPDTLLDGEELKNRLLRRFVSIYPEFTSLLDPDNNSKFYLIVDKVNYFFTKYKCMSDAHIHKGLEFMYFLLLGHFLTLEGVVPGLLPTTGAGALGAPGDLVSSASVGDVSISFDTSVHTQAYSRSAFKHYLGRTKFGREYLALLDYTTGLLCVN